MASPWPFGPPDPYAPSDLRAAGLVTPLANRLRRHGLNTSTQARSLTCEALGAWLDQWRVGKQARADILSWHRRLLATAPDTQPPFPTEDPTRRPDLAPLWVLGLPDLTVRLLDKHRMTTVDDIDRLAPAARQLLRGMGVTHLRWLDRALAERHAFTDAFPVAASSDHRPWIVLGLPQPWHAEIRRGGARTVADLHAWAAQDSATGEMALVREALRAGHYDAATQNGPGRTCEAAGRRGAGSTVSVASLPVGALGCPRLVTETLSASGVSTIADLQDLDTGAVQALLGHTAAEVLDVMRYHRVPFVPRLGTQAKWATGIVALGRYVEREGHARPAHGCVEAGFPLGEWVSQLRRSHRVGTLPDWNVRQLERLPGWVWWIARPFPGDPETSRLTVSARR